MRLTLRSALAALALALTPAAPALAEDVLPDRRIVMQEGIDLPGADLSQLFNTTLQACAATCLADDACEALTYNHRSRACFPKTAGGTPTPFPGASSGIVLATSPELLAGAEAKVAAADRWLTSEDRAAARRQAVALGVLYPGNAGDDVAALRDLARDAAERNDAPTAVRWIGATAATSDAPADWLSLAQWMSADGHDGDMSAAAMSAAINAWLRDPGAGTEALRLWAELAERQGRGRDGLNALRLAAQGDTDPALAEQLKGFEERHGFRVSETRVDADAPTPRACAVMSEEVAAGTDLAPFVALPDPTLAVEADGWQLCVTGVTHGQELRLTLRKGLPAASGEVLARDVPLTLYVRDRAPLVRFAGRAYVLPATGDQGLTMHTVNTDRVDLTLYRMSDRNLVQALRDGLFGAPFTSWREGQFTSRFGTEVWQGEADVAAAPGGGQPPINAEAATRLDIGAAAGPLAPGIYVLAAKVPGQTDDRSPPAAQWFMISDLGLTAFSGNDGLTVAIRGLSDAGAREGVVVELISRGNAVLGSAVTDAEGLARFAAGLTRGRDAAAPALVTATAREGDAVRDLAFLSLIEPEFDLSDRGVEGNPPGPPIDVFLATDRGAYRAGETVHATILARDNDARALSGLPLTAVLIRPDGVEQARLMPPEAGAGGHVLDFELPGTAPRGSWRIDLRVEADGPPLATARVLVEDFRPERLDFSLTLPDGPIPADAGVLPVAFDARWLYGAPASGLPVEGELVLTPARALPGREGFVFGRHDAAEAAEFETLPPGTTDDTGHYAADIPLPAAVAGATQPLQAEARLRLREGAGRPVERSDSRIVTPARGALGVKPAFEGGAVPEGGEAGFDLIALDAALAPRPAEVSWVLNRIRTDYQWFALDGQWSWEPVTTRQRLTDGTLTLTPAGPARLSLPVEWGEFELVVTDAAGAETSTTFSAGWGAAGAGSDTPDRLRVTLDRPAYSAGDTATVTLEAGADGIALVSVLADRLVTLQVVPVTAGANSLALPVTDDWGAGVYVAVSAIRPLDASAVADHAPIRAIGLVPAGVDPGDRRLDASLTAPPEAEPRGEATVRLTVAGARPGETVHATIAAVDQGILNLTRFTPPDPLDHYFGQRRLGVGLRDLYGRLILPSGAADGAIRTGGDAGAGRLQAPPPTERLMAWFSGPLTLGPDGSVEAAVPLPDFNGEVRLMAVAWSASGVGQADTTMLVRDPVVLTVTVPAFLAPGDRAEAGIALAHVTGPAGEVGLAVTPTGEQVDLATSTLPASVTLAERQRQAVPLTLTAPDREGLANLRFTATLPGGQEVTKDIAVTVARQDPEVTRAMRVTLEPGGSATLDPASLGAFRPGAGRATLTTGAWAQLDLGAALMRLASYPYGCTEQLVSGAMPLLYAGSLLPAGRDLPGSAMPADVDEAISLVLTRQNGSGGFGLWDAFSSDPWLDAYVTDFLTRARATGHAVPETALQRALTNLQNRLNAGIEPQYAEAWENAATAYSAYVLAREGQAVVSDLRYYADTAADAFATPLAAAQLGAALAAVGDTGRADRMFARAEVLLTAPPPEEEQGFRQDYGTRLRDTAGALALAAEAGSEALDRAATATLASTEVARLSEDGAPLSTQEAVWLVLAGQALAQGGGDGLMLDGAPMTAPMAGLGEPSTLGDVVLTNPTQQPVDATLSLAGMPADPPRAGGTAYRITRAWFTPEGEPADPATVAQGTRLIATLEITPLPGAGDGGRLVVTDPLPAGIEIDNPNLLGAGEIAGLDWLGGLQQTEMAEFRQDRFAAAVTWTGDAPFRLAYRVRAVTPGDFAHPAATVEDMYRPERRGWTDSGRVTITR